VRRLLLVLLILSCRSQRALVTPQPDAAGASAEGGVTPPDGHAEASPDLASAPDVWTLPPVVDAAVAGDLSPDRPPPIDLGPAPKCEQAGTFKACIEAGDGKSYFRRRDDRQCGLCQLGRDGSVGSPAHCTIGDPDDTIVYCARSCFDCCHTVRGAPCEGASDCCLPLVCTSVGTRRFCDLPPP
jgi:hypothetical protein